MTWHHGRLAGGCSRRTHGPTRGDALAVAAELDARARRARQPTLERVVGMVVALAVGLFVLLGLAAGDGQPCRLTMATSDADCAEDQGGPGIRIDWPRSRLTGR